MDKKLDLENAKVYSNTIKDIKDALDLIGAKVYMSDYEDFFPYRERELTGISYDKGYPDTTNYPFIGADKNGCRCGYRYFVLAKDVKLKNK